MVFRRHIFRERLKRDMFFAAPENTSVSSSPNHHTKVKFDPDLRVLTHKSYSFHIFEDKTDSFQLHELCHLVHSIHYYGTPAILNDLSGERSLQAIKKIKKLTNPGGTSFERMVFRRHIFRERLKMDMFFDAPVNTSVSSSPNHHTK